VGSEPSSEGLNERLFEKAPKLFDHVPDISDQSKTPYWIEKSASFNMICITRNMSEPIAAKSRPEIIHGISNKFCIVNLRV
jgi:hypothetical protein